MSKKNLTWIAIIVIIILGLTAWWFLSHENSTTPASQTTQTNQNLFPYGQNTTQTTNQSNQSNTNGQVILGGSSTTPPALIHITTTPVSGMIFLPEGKGSTTTLRYIDRGTGHIYDYSFDAGTSTEITDTTIPKVYAGFFSNDGARVYLQTLDGNNLVQTMAAAVPSATTSGQVGGLSGVVFLPKNITSFAAGSSSIFYLVGATDGSTGYTSTLDGAKSTRVFSSALGELVAKWQNNDVALITKASASANGYLFDLNTKTGAFTPIIKNVAGLTALPNLAGTFIFGSATTNGSVESFMYDEKKSAARAISISTIAEKCVWSATNSNSIYCAVPTGIGGTLPDDWYEGNVYLSSDNIWKITADTGVTNIVDFLSERNPNIDAENLVLDGKEKWLAFMDKEDLTLWALRIAQ